MTCGIPWTPALAAAEGTSDRRRGEPVDEALVGLFAELEGCSDGARRQRLLGALYDAIAVDLHGIALWRTGCREDAADAVQAVFVRLAEGRVRFDRVRSPRLFLLAMAHRAAIDLVRRRRRTVELDEPSLPASLLVEPASAGAAAEAAELSRWLHALPGPQREALYLRYFAGLSYREIGGAVGVPTFTAASRCRLGLAALRRRAGRRGGGARGGRADG
ncbi:MAG TPA: sigma-70 family RNA polymerase sigma factor [Thermoanaerobaculia bacterium]|nr:sigma-70 family RNA polymerase sigma factor [Thermoanaerobaculia bacterium]